MCSLNELQHEVRDKLGGGDDEWPRLVERLGVVFYVANLPHQRGEPPERKTQLLRSVSFTRALYVITREDAPVEAVHQPLAYSAEVSDVGHYCAVRGVRLQVHWEGKRCRNICVCWSKYVIREIHMSYISGAHEPMGSTFGIMRN